MPFHGQKNQRFLETPLMSASRDLSRRRDWRDATSFHGPPGCYAGDIAATGLRAMIIRDATEADVPEIQSIYAHHVLTGTGTFEEEPPSVEHMLGRYRNIVEHGWRWLVAADETGVLGYGYFSQFRPRSAYRYCVEDSIYVRENVRGQGVGKALVQALIEICTAAGMCQMIAVIGDSDNVGSIGVHASLGFQRAGTLRASGIKFGRWLDTVYMQRALGRGDLDIPA
jgi:L-amino acid N-acyltransferase YncA